MISLSEARQIISAAVQPLPALQVPLSASLGRVLAEPAVADAPYPAGDRSMMDGYVVRGDEGPGEFRVVGEIPAGAIPRQRLQRGECLRIFTGALLPEGGGRVIMQEQVRRTRDGVTIERFPESRWVRMKGQEAQPGDVILPAGIRLGPAELAILAQVGAVQPKVVQPPAIRHLATGGEIVAPEETPGPAQIRDTNSTLLCALLSDLGVPTIDTRRVSDDAEAIIALGNQPADLLLISGGASVGDYDFGAEALRRLGFTIHFDRVNLRPGKPLTFATQGSRAAFVIPGNPVSHFVCFHVAIRLAVERLLSLAPAWNFVRLELRGGEPLRVDPRETYWPGRVFGDGGRLVVAPKRWSTSGDTFALAGTNALIRVHENSPADGWAETLLLDVPTAS